MNKKQFLGLLFALVVTTTAIAANYPSYYPEEGLQRTGRVDAIYPAENRIVIGDIPYQMSDSPIVHSLTAYSVSIARVRPGVIVGFNAGQSRVINEFWLMPPDYDPRERRQ